MRNNPPSIKGRFFRSENIEISPKVPNNLPLILENNEYALSSRIGIPVSCLRESNSSHCWGKPKWFMMCINFVYEVISFLIL